MDSDLFKLIGLICQIIVALLFTGSFIIAYFNLLAFNRSNNISTLKHILDEYQELVECEAFELYQEELTDWKNRLAESKLTAHSFYYRNMKSVAKIGQFYDYVGVMVDKDIIEFSLLFEVLPFAHTFWEETADFRALMQQVTYADFWSHFISLQRRYTEEQKQRKTPKKLNELLNQVSKNRYKLMRHKNVIKE